MPQWSLDGLLLVVKVFLLIASGLVRGETSGWCEERAIRECFPGSSSWCHMSTMGRGIKIVPR